MSMFILDLLCLVVAFFVITKITQEDAITVTEWYIPFIVLSYLAYYSGVIDYLGMWWYVLCVFYFTWPCTKVDNTSVKFIYIGLSILLMMIGAEVWLNNTLYKENPSQNFTYFFFDYHTLILTVSYLIQIGVSSYGGGIRNYCSILFSTHPNKISN